MGIQAGNSADRLRTVWTLEMDRYFIDLMLEQVKEGNRYDDLIFSKMAWKHMSALFNENFKFQYEKDILKNRHKTLRNLYRATKDLLSQKGFSWDSERKMVTTDNRVWDEYLKVNRNARSFRVKAIPYYEELCLIYGSGKDELEGDNDDRSVDFDENKILVSEAENAGEDVAEIVHINNTVDEDSKIIVPQEIVKDQVHETSNATPLSISYRTRTSWEPTMDRYFINLLLEQVRKANQIDGVFRKEAWTDMIVSFNAKFGYNYDVDILKNRYKTLKRQYNAVKNLLQQDGFAWDDTRQMVTADDFVWHEYIQGHCDARQFMKRPVPYYKELRVICGDGSIVETDCVSPQCLELQNEVQMGNSHGAGRCSQSPAESGEDQVGDVMEPLLIDSNSKRRSESQLCSAHLKKSRSEKDKMASALREMATAVSSLMEKSKDDDNSNLASIENVIAAIQALPEMDEELILDACDFLEDDIKAKTFMALDAKLRKKWLLRKLRPES